MLPVVRPSGPMRGFTLIELMITVAIVGILSAIAFPAYTQYVKRGKIADALGEMSTLRVKFEQYYQDKRNYGTTASSCGVPLPTNKPGFAYTCSWGAGSTSQSFVITATGLPSGGMGGYVYTVDETNAQSTTQFDGVAATSACWIKKKGESC
jgi:type IV pilus assembly protein PilE